MRYAIVSDIHANLEALIAVLAAADDAGVQQIVCLGDLVGYYADPNACVELLRGRGIPCVRGNHDSVAAGMQEPVEFSEMAQRAIRWTADQLTAANRQYLAALPLVHCIDDAFVVVHAALHPQPNENLRIRSEADAASTLQMLLTRYGGQRLCFFGHTHQPVAYFMRNGTVKRLEVEDQPSIRLSDDACYLINPGSVGQSRGADPRAAMIVYDAAARVVAFHRIRYDTSVPREKAIAMGLIPRPHLLRRSAKWLKNRLGAAAVAPQSKSVLYNPIAHWDP